MLIRTTLINMAVVIDSEGVPESIDLGTIIFPTKPMAYRNATKNTRYVIIP
jgi:hypothetical protein